MFFVFYLSIVSYFFNSVIIFSSLISFDFSLFSITRRFDIFINKKRLRIKVNKIDKINKIGKINEINRINEISKTKIKSVN